MAVPHWKLPLAFDAAQLQRDVAGLGAEEWSPHFNQRQYDGEWSGVPLRSTPRSHMPLYPDPASTEFIDLPVLDRCPYLREVMAQFDCPLTFVRLLKLAPGSNILEHRDHCLSYEDGEVRIHIPVFTNPEVEFVVGGEALPLKHGECWYINFNLPHRIHNRGTTDRVHLVIDCRLNLWLDAMFPK
ncbi:MAG TPA: aspartyl/asparaginyl beta-hydroxylase domain-containing protein [Candidatus Solibacter sp.]|nr:aspartyl/asparaginyl beta-hydroxylase domain-containing protein [Candidatus Solibacter sp.]